MAGPWDSMTKRMIGANPEHFVKWLDAEAVFVAALDIELKSQHIFADALLKVIKKKKPGLSHIEIQAYADPEMPRRLLEYNMLAWRQYDYLPVYSSVICLREEADVADPPFIRRFPDEEGEEVHRFYYRVIRLWLIPAEVLLHLGWMGLLPLVTLTQGGKQPEVVKGMIDRLAQAQEWDLLAISQLLGGLAFKQGSERDWFKRRFSMFQDILKDSWVYQEIGQEFHEEGRVQEQHEVLKSFLQLRFPETLALANQQTNNIKDPAVLRTVLTKLFTAQTVEEVRQILLEVNKQ